MAASRDITGRPVVMATAAVLLQFALIVIGARIAHVSPVTWSSYERFDSAHYLSIATDGYRIAYCQPDNSTVPIVGEPRPARERVYCGNSGWFPGYSYLVRGLWAMGANKHWAAMFCSWALRWLGLWCIASWLRHSQVDRPSAVLTMIAAAAFPGGIYYLAVFPVALTVLMLMLCIAGARRENFWLAGAAAFAASLSYSSGWVGPTAVSGCLVLTAVRQKQWKTFWLAATVVCAALAGVLTVFAIQYWQTGFWQAYFLQQGTFEHTYGVGVLLAYMRASVTEILSSPVSLDSAWGWQSVLVLVFLLTSTVVAIRNWRSIDRLAEFSLAVALGCWVFPKLVSGDAGQVRYEALLIPILSVFPMLPRVVQWVATTAFVVLTPFIAALFFQKMLV